MTRPRKSQLLFKTLLLGSAATFVFAAAPVDLSQFDLSFASAAGRQGDDSGGNGRGGAGRAESRGGSSATDHGESSDHDEPSDHGGSTDRGGASGRGDSSDRGRSGGGEDRESSRGSSHDKAATESAPKAPVYVAPSKAPSSKGKSAARGGGGGNAPAQSLRPVVRESDDDSDSDRPEWAGVPGGPTTGGGKPDSAADRKGDLFGDLWVIARYDDGTPILITSDGILVRLVDIDGSDLLVEVDDLGDPVLVDGEPVVISGSPTIWVQPVDADGNLIPLDEEGMPIDEDLAQEVEIGRLNVGRSPSHVLSTREDEVVAVLKDADEITTDAAGRLVLTIDGEAKTIDSPLENLAIYVALLTEGTIPGVGDLPGDEFDFLIDGQLTAEDLAYSTAFLAAATDKSGELTADQIAYIDAFLGIETETIDSVTYANIDYSDFSYDRSDTYGGVMVDVLVFEDGVWVEKSVDVYLEVFEGDDVSGSGTLDAYTLAADDARAVIEFIHEYAIPEDLSHSATN
ncbi:hypothetical protein [Tropicimonas sp. IMCC6043]|uniref:hypothetical protein n=1 Tax=Tropicimonas sp. IMCC6043 TaxID=2510645 RepID=UPI00101C6E77|nr:hypothetical protein [Tropicimonas sp. IMCC6043]RYH11600.1 hypothetical protein EU800_02890 [Tropicimonas sp. IMCC6043]